MRLLLVLALALPLAAGCERIGGLAPVTHVGSAAESAGGAVIVARGDTAYSISRRYGVPLRDLIDVNQLQAPYTLEVGQRLVLPASRQYIVQRGDTLYGISRMFGVDSSELARLNSLPAPYAVQAGQPLRLPAGGARGGTETAEAPQPVTRGSVQATELPPPGGQPVPVSPAPSTTVPVPVPSGKPMGTPLPAPSGTVGVGPEGAGGYQPGEAPKTLRPPGSKPASPVESAQAPVAAPEPQAETVAVAPPPRAEVGEPPPRGSGRFLWPVKGRVLSSFGPKPDGLHNDGINIAAGKGATVVAADNGVVAYAGNELRGFGNLLLIKHSDGWITAYAHLDRMDVERGAKVKRGQAIGTVGQTGSATSPQLHFELRKGSQAVDPRDQMDGAAPKLSEGVSPGGRQGPG